MSHGPESHGSHHEPAPEPERIPIDDPGEAGVDYKVISPNGFVTTHRGPDGVFYTIQNKSAVEAIWRLGAEDQRNARLAKETKNQLEFAAENGLWRTNSVGQVIRPAASGEAFTAQVTNDGTETTPGNYDIGNPGGYISYGQGESSSNELAAISERSTSIVESYTARDAALAEGSTFQEAQAVGSEVYLEQERLRKLNDVGFTQPEAASVTFIETPPVLTSLSEDDNTAERDTHPVKPTKQFLKEIGHSIIFRAKLTRSGAVPLEAHSTVHKALDYDFKDAIDAKVSGALTKFETADEKYSGDIREFIENLPFLTSLALEQGTERSKQFTVDQFNKAKEKLNKQGKSVINAILFLHDKVIGKRKRVWARTGTVYNDRVNSRIKLLKQYLATKHPANPKYET